MKDYAKLTDSELLDIIDSSNVKSKEFRSIKELSATDPIFRSRIIELQARNKDLSDKSGNDLISLLEGAILEATDEEVKNKLIGSLSNIKSILNK